jgi:hypothetical protein
MRSYGVECKNPECNSATILGEYMTRPQRQGDRISFPVLNPQRIKCQACGREYEYTQADLREFPLVEGDSGTLENKK